MWFFDLEVQTSIKYLQEFLEVFYISIQIVKFRKKKLKWLRMCLIKLHYTTFRIKNVLIFSFLN